MKLCELLAGIVPCELDERHGNQPVSGVFDDSRRVRPGGLFVAVPGVRVDGRSFIDDARARGAVAVISQAGGASPPGAGARAATALPAPGAAPGPLLIVDDARRALARLAARWHRLDDAALPCRLLGVTGTNGKSTVAYMVREILRAAGRPCGMLGTIAYDLCGRVAPSRLTTPGPLELADMLRECIDRGAEAVVMEVSSHALDQQRTAGLRFAAAALTNVTQDHLDYHADMDAYADAKARLFAQLPADAVAVINADDPYAPRVVGDFTGRTLRYAIHSRADLTARVLRSSARGVSFRLTWDGRSAAVDSPLIGEHNVANALAAAGLAAGIGVPFEAIGAGLTRLAAVPGRLQRVSGIAELDVFVDYAHTPDALVNACRTMRQLARRRLIVVFGCGGDRDRAKRPLMGRAAARHAHGVIVTSDNPRSEDPQRIIADVLAGYDATERQRVLVEPDRRQAIGAALAAAQPGDIVLIAGKGHESEQVIGAERLPFDDAQVAREMAGALQEAPGA